VSVIVLIFAFKESFSYQHSDICEKWSDQWSQHNMSPGSCKQTHDNKFYAMFMASCV